MTIVCPSCLDPGHFRGRFEMRITGEFTQGWRAECSQCGTIRFVDKAKVGGTIGAGQRADGAKGTVGRGYGPGRYNPVR